MADCDACGCEPFGGGSCVDGRGCVVPQPDGSPCTMDAECAPHACLRDTGTCGPPRAMGELCSVDAECATHNCSTDGDETQTGVCNQELGTVCSSTGMTATCTNCFYWDLTFDPVCARAFCDPVDAPCPQLGDSRRVWSCELSADGRHRCYEHCDDFGYNCFDSGDFCTNGYCS